MRVGYAGWLMLLFKLIVAFLAESAVQFQTLSVLSKEASLLPNESRDAMSL